MLCNSVYTVLLSGKKQSYQIFNHQKFRTNSEQISLIFRLKLRTNEPRPKLLVLIKNKVCEDCSRRLGLGQGTYTCVRFLGRGPLSPARLRTGFRFQRLPHSERGGRGRGGRSYLTLTGSDRHPARKRRGESVISAETTCNKVYLTCTKCTLGSALRLYSRQSGQHLVSINHAVHLPSVLSKTSMLFLSMVDLGQYPGFK